jgi:hypothetical protein
MLKTLLLDTVVSKFLSKCAELQLYDNFSSLLAKLDQYATPNYIPTNDDILKIHTRTTGVLEHNITCNDLEHR